MTENTNQAETILVSVTTQTQNKIDNRSGGQGRPTGGSDRSSRSLAPRRRNRAPRYKDRRDLPRTRRLAPLVDRPSREHIEGVTDETLKIIPLGGLGEVGRNMSVLEYKNDIMIIDVGFGFPEEDKPGIDYTLPNPAYLDGKQNRIRGIVITHGHMDHTGGVPYLMHRLGNPPIYCTNLTRGIVLKRHEEFPHLPKLDIELVKPGDIIKLGEFQVGFFHVNHNIPEDVALVITTPAGRIVHTADFKFDPTPLNEPPADLNLIKSIGDSGVSVLMSDSTGAEKEGRSISESVIQDNLEGIFKEASEGMLIAATFSSIINRIQQLISLSEKYGRKIVFDGYSLRTNVEIAKELNQIRIGKDTQIPISDIDRYPRNKITLVGTGAQGEERAVLMRIASGEHRYVQLQKKDSVIFSSSVIPGNERTVQRLKDLLYRMGAKVFDYNMMDIHASGHAYKDDLRQMIRLIQPKTLMPIHGQYSMMVNHGYLGEKEGVPNQNIIIADNGSILHIYDPHFADHDSPINWWFDKHTAPSDEVMVDGLGVGDIGNVVLRDRQVLAQDGFVSIITLIDSKTTRVRGSPDIISRGFIYLKDNKDMLAQIRKRIRFIVEKKTTRPINWVDLKEIIKEEIGLFLFQKTERRPMILPVVIEV